MASCQRIVEKIKNAPPLQTRHKRFILLPPHHVQSAYNKRRTIWMMASTVHQCLVENIATALPSPDMWHPRTSYEHVSTSSARISSLSLRGKDTTVHHVWLGEQVPKYLLCRQRDARHREGRCHGKQVKAFAEKYTGNVHGEPTPQRLRIV